jgi:Kef-type K+ transport system membrane component KefB/Trk K+ transport system NAD-binding subunit
MEDHISITSLMLVVGIAFLVPILLHRFRLGMIPVVVAEIVMGIIIGKSGLNLISEDPWLKLLSLLGFIFLMFLSGVEIDFDLLKNKTGRKNQNVANPFVIAILVFIGILVTSLLLSYGMVWGNFIKEPFLMTLIIATISLGVVVPVLKERRATETPLGQTILIIAVLSDFVTMILLSVYISLLAHDVNKVIMLLAFFAVVVALYYVFRYYSRRQLFSRLRKGTIQLGTRAVFALILLFVVLSESFGAQNILGAFLAGVIVSLLSPRKEFLHQLDSFGYGFLIPIFFVMVGVKLDIRQIFAQPSMIMLIPVLLIVLLISKMLPILILRRWYPWRETIGAGVLLTSTLSLVIAAATVAHDLGLIKDELKNALILVAVITSFISPILFNRIYPKKEGRKKKISIIGANTITLPVALRLQTEGFQITVFSECDQGLLKERREIFKKIPFVELPSLDPSILHDHDVFQTDVIVVASEDDRRNVEISHHALQEGTEQIVVRVENPELQESVTGEKITIFSTMYSVWTLLKAMVEHPSAVRLFSQPDGSIQEVVVKNYKYHNVPLRQLSFLGDALILRIYRMDSFMIPHGDTRLHLGDRLLISGSLENIVEIKQELE